MMGCWDTKPKTEEQIKAQMQTMLKHPLYVKFFKVPQDGDSVFLKELDEPIDYLRLIE
jgi:hypothetical protein